jgi:hypothetical protein
LLPPELSWNYVIYTVAKFYSTVLDIYKILYPRDYGRFAQHSEGIGRGGPFPVGGKGAEIPITHSCRGIEVGAPAADLAGSAVTNKGCARLEGGKERLY